MANTRQSVADILHDIADAIQNPSAPELAISVEAPSEFSFVQMGSLDLPGVAADHLSQGTGVAFHPHPAAQIGEGSAAMSVGSSDAAWTGAGGEPPAPGGVAPGRGFRIPVELSVRIAANWADWVERARNEGINEYTWPRELDENEHPAQPIDEDEEENLMVFDLPGTLPSVSSESSLFTPRVVGFMDPDSDPIVLPEDARRAIGLDTLAEDAVFHTTGRATDNLVFEDHFTFSQIGNLSSGRLDGQAGSQHVLGGAGGCDAESMSDAGPWVTSHQGPSQFVFTPNNGLIRQLSSPITGSRAKSASGEAQNESPFPSPNQRPIAGPRRLRTFSSGAWIQTVSSGIECAQDAAEKIIAHKHKLESDPAEDGAERDVKRAKLL
ncbi:unnamed protein product [Mycena citricolor]|uniref:Uncharacterized protein n=1 Tax=Mycena citricolor TaxID=2018698 RepID=A0AAD2HIZ4_9AGAR|nr:unnamed protein product [Mycena citricolor]CAK5276486.1 unnamed protein product [Mycena citricolor]CAK5276816.1 unnamed protein product [Mycena citricolor]CAK5276827.1 unnamed protein product [Mycena citricolor]